jgi:hypothetical protein
MYLVIGDPLLEKYANWVSKLPPADRRAAKMLLETVSTKRMILVECKYLCTYSDCHRGTFVHIRTYGTNLVSTKRMISVQYKYLCTYSNYHRGTFVHIRTYGTNLVSTKRIISVQCKYLCTYIQRLPSRYICTYTNFHTINWQTQEATVAEKSQIKT